MYFRYTYGFEKSHYNWYLETDLAMHMQTTNTAYSSKEEAKDIRFSCFSRIGLSQCGRRVR